VETQKSEDNREVKSKNTRTEGEKQGEKEATHGACPMVGQHSFFFMRRTPRGYAFGPKDIEGRAATEVRCRMDSKNE
jgi:hypothetical protein